MSRGRRVWRAVRWTLGVVLALYIGLVLYRIPAVGEKERTAQAVAFIHSQKVTLDDVMGKNVPHIPDPTISSTTLAGVDENKNGIRDDVEIWILEHHYPSARIRAAEMQYALALQMELTQVFNSETLVAAIQEDGRAGLCISETAPALSPTSTEEEDKRAFAIADERQKEVENLVLNTNLRKEKYNEIYEKYMTSYASLSGRACDIGLQSLPN